MNQISKINLGGIDYDVRDNSKYVSITYADLVSLRDNGELVAGSYYRIIDYITTAEQENTQSAGHPFDVIVLALSKNTLAEEAYAIQSARDTDGYFANSNLAAWKLWYSLDNDTDRFAWAAPADGKIRKVALVKYGYSNYTAYHDASKDTEVNGKKLYAWNQGGGPGQTGYSDTLDITSESKVYTSSGEEDTSASFLVEVTDTEKGKGVIYRMIDEWHNDVPYDFKNIQYFVNGQLVYTFANADDLKGGCYCNEIKPYRVGGAQKLNNIRFDGNCYYNSFGNNCSNNSFGNSCGNNSFGNSCGNNSFGNNCSNNSFGNSCGNNSFGNDCSNNSFGNDCSNNSFGNSCGNNSFGGNCYYNSFGDNCYYNSFGNNCDNNSFGNDCSNNSFGENCDYNSFNGATSEDKGNYYRNNHLGRGVNFCHFTNAATASSFQYVQNYDVAQGLSSQTIEVTRDLAYETKVALTTSGELKMFNLADLA